MNIDIHLKECATSDHYQHLKSSILKMQKKFDEYWPKIKDDAIACQLLDPRFKHYTLKSATNKQNVKFLPYAAPATWFLRKINQFACVLTIDA
jgi:hypothetical protein